MSMQHPPPFPDRPPTDNEIKDNAIVGGCMAAWYPQMGGYSGKCWVRPGCFGDDGDTPGMDVAVYHDGDFPFDENSPTNMHHCSAEQFIRFGRLSDAFLSAVVEPGGAKR